MEAFREPYTQTFMRYFDFPGTEPTLVFLAGLGMASTAAFPQTAVEPGLSHRRAIMVDWLGCGYSDKPGAFGYTLEDHAATISALLDHLGSRQYVLVGHSMGGAVAIEVAAQRSDLIGQLILAEGNLYAGGGSMSAHIAAQSEQAFVSDGYQAIIEQRRQAAMGGDSAAAIGLGVSQVASPPAIHRSAVGLVKGTRPVMWENLIRLTIPRTYIFGGRSLEELAEDRELRQRLQAHGIQVAVVPDAGHAMMLDNRVGFAAAISRAVDEAWPR